SPQLVLQWRRVHGSTPSLSKRGRARPGPYASGRIDPDRHMLRGALILAIALTLFIAPASRAQEEQPDAAPAVEQPTEPSLVDRLRQGGYVIYLRHASTDFSQADSDLVNLQN